MSQDAAAWVEHGRQQSQNGDYEAALFSFDQAIALDPNNPKAWEGKGQVLQKLGRYGEAIAANCVARKLYNSPVILQWTTEFNQTAEEWCEQGIQQEQLRDFTSAIFSYDQAITLKPEFKEAWSNRGAILNNLNRYEEAIESANKSIQIDPKYAHGWYVKGFALSRLFCYEEAIISFNQANALDPNYWLSWLDLSHTLINLGRYEEAIITLNRAIALEPNYWPSWLSLSHTLINLGRYEEAIASLDRVIYLKSDNHEAWHSKGVLLYRFLKRCEEAIPCFESAVNIEPNNNYQSWHEWGEALKNLGLYEEALEKCDKALEVNPNYHEAWNSKGEVLRYLGRCEEAISCYEISWTTHRDDYRLPYNRGLALLQLGRYEEAIFSYLEGLRYWQRETHPQGWGNLHWAIGKAHFFEGQMHENPFPFWCDAVRSYKTALTALTATDFPEAHLEVLQDLIRVHMNLGEIETADKNVEQGLVVLRELLNSTPSPGWQRQLALKFSKLSQLAVNVLVQKEESVAALEAAELCKNRTLIWILDRWKEQVISPGYAEMQQLLSATTAVVYWHLSPDALITFIFKADRPQPILLDSDRLSSLRRLQAFETWCNEWNRQYNDYRGKKKDASESKKDHSWRREMQQRLFERQTEPGNLKNILNIAAIEQHLEGITHLILIPHRDLHRFPLHALFDQQFTITYLPSAQIGLNLQQRDSAKVDYQHLLNVDDPDNDQAAMPYAQLESAVIRQLVGTPTCLGQKNATKEAVVAALAKNYSTFHFTGHGAYDIRRPENSALGLAGTERLTAQEISQLNLESYNLISLAACETALTGSQTIEAEYVGLVSAFLQAKAANVVSTLWNVEEISSAYFMIRFYQFLLEGHAPAVALKQAQHWLQTWTHATLNDWLLSLSQLDGLHPLVKQDLELQVCSLPEHSSTMNSSHPPFADPYYWAAFTLTGRGFL